MNELFDKNWVSAILLRDNSPSSTVFEILAFLCFAFFAQKFENSKWPPFLASQFFLKIGMATLERYPVGQKFRRKRSI